MKIMDHERGTLFKSLIFENQETNNSEPPINDVNMFEFSLNITRNIFLNNLRNVLYPLSFVHYHTHENQKNIKISVPTNTTADLFSQFILNRNLSSNFYWCFSIPSDILIPLGIHSDILNYSELHPEYIQLKCRKSIWFPLSCYQSGRAVLI